jgi:hypothetical protein
MGPFVTVCSLVMLSSIGRNVCWWSRRCFAKLDLLLSCVYSRACSLYRRMAYRFVRYIFVTVGTVKLIYSTSIAFVVRIVTDFSQQCTKKR